MQGLKNVNRTVANKVPKLKLPQDQAVSYDHAFFIMDIGNTKPRKPIFLEPVFGIGAISFGHEIKRNMYETT